MNAISKSLAPVFFLLTACSTTSSEAEKNSSVAKTSSTEVISIEPKAASPNVDSIVNFTDMQNVDFRDIPGWPSSLSQNSSFGGLSVSAILSDCSEKLKRISDGVYFFGGIASSDQVQLRAAAPSEYGGNKGRRFWCTYRRNINRVSITLADISDVGYTSPPYIATEKTSIPRNVAHIPNNLPYSFYTVKFGLLDGGGQMIAAYVPES